MANVRAICCGILVVSVYWLISSLFDRFVVLELLSIDIASKLPRPTAKIRLDELSCKYLKLQAVCVSIHLQRALAIVKLLQKESHTSECLELLSLLKG